MSLFKPAWTGSFVSSPWKSSSPPLPSGSLRKGLYSPGPVITKIWTAAWLWPRAAYVTWMTRNYNFERVASYTQDHPGPQEPGSLWRAGTDVISCSFSTSWFHHWASRVHKNRLGSLHTKHIPGHHSLEILIPYIRGRAQDPALFIGFHNV